MTDSPPDQLNTDALNTATPNLADLYIYIYIEQCTYTYSKLTPLAIEHRCLEYHYTKLGRSIYIEQCIYTHGRLTPLAIEHRCLEYCYTKLGRYSTMHIYPNSRWTPLN